MSGLFPFGSGRGFVGEVEEDLGDAWYFGEDALGDLCEESFW
jgi:hypothetical protein